MLCIRSRNIFPENFPAHSNHGYFIVDGTLIARRVSIHQKVVPFKLPVVFQFLTLLAKTNNMIIIYVFPTVICFWIFDVNGFWCENDVIRLETLFTKTLLAEVTLFEYNVSIILLLIVGSDVVMVTTCTCWCRQQHQLRYDENCSCENCYQNITISHKKLLSG